MTRWDGSPHDHEFKGRSPSASVTMEPLTRSKRVERVQTELEQSIDADLAREHGGHPVEVDFHVLDRYTAYIGFRAAETYRKIALVLSAVVAASTVASLVIAFR